MRRGEPIFTHSYVVADVDGVVVVVVAADVGVAVANDVANFKVVADVEVVVVVVAADVGVAVANDVANFKVAGDVSNVVAGLAFENNVPDVAIDVVVVVVLLVMR